MSLVLIMIRCPDAVTPERREVFGGEFSIGRGLNNDWVLADPERHLSKQHCQLAFRSGEWQLADLSSNGTYLNGGSAPVGPTSSRPLRDGDRISFAGYELEVLVNQRDNVDSSSQRARPGQSAAFDDNSFDPFAEPTPVARPLGNIGPSQAGGMLANPNEGIRLPLDFDPLGDPLDGLIGMEADNPFRGPTHSDHAPALDGAFRPSPSTTMAIPDDWDLDAPSSLPLEAEVAPPVQAQLTPAIAPSPNPVASSALVASPAPLTNAGDADLLAAFMRGTGLEAAIPSDPRLTMELAGAALRAAVSGIRQALIARASIRGEFRIEQTMIRSTGNNPLKFSADDDDALAAFLGIGRRAMPGADALTEALSDMRLHELATMTAMQSAVRALLAQFDPVAIEASSERGGFARLPGQRKIRAWEAFEAMHTKVSQAMSDDFDSIFGKAFARAYEKAIAELSERFEQP